MATSARRLAAAVQVLEGRNRRLADDLRDRLALEELGLELIVEVIFVEVFFGGEIDLLE